MRRLSLLARSNNGFTTCLVLRVDANGSMIIANAGHIPPCLAGQGKKSVNPWSKQFRPISHNISHLPPPPTLPINSLFLATLKGSKQQKAAR
jgi:hypothetical protein